ncbi:MAG: hypothetical protein M1823_004979 [Watsoniomyces obsoletus]|nr:MAG: hypothetical protein M1823_004979 [Watsoniomyces obsoletus]
MSSPSPSSTTMSSRFTNPTIPGVSFIPPPSTGPTTITLGGRVIVAFPSGASLPTTETVITRLSTDSAGRRTTVIFTLNTGFRIDPPTRTATALETTIDPEVTRWTQAAPGDVNPLSSLFSPPTITIFPSSATSGVSASIGITAPTPSIPATFITSIIPFSTPSTSPTTSTQATAQRAASGLSGSGKTAVISAGSVGGVIILGVFVWVFRVRIFNWVFSKVSRRYKREVYTSIMEEMVLPRHEPPRTAETAERTSEEDVTGVTEARSSEEAVEPDTENMGRSTSLPPPRLLQGFETDATRRRAGSKEDLASPRVPGHDQVLPAPQAKPVFRPWRGFLDPRDYELSKLKPGPLSVSEHYSTQAGEGSVPDTAIDDEYIESEEQRQERLYRKGQPNHTPPPGSEWPMSRGSRPSSLFLAGHGYTMDASNVDEERWSAERAAGSVEDDEVGDEEAIQGPGSDATSGRVAGGDTVGEVAVGGVYQAAEGEEAQQAGGAENHGARLPAGVNYTGLEEPSIGSQRAMGQEGGNIPAPAVPADDPASLPPSQPAPPSGQAIGPPASQQTTSLGPGSSDLLLERHQSALTAPQPQLSPTITAETTSDNRGSSSARDSNDPLPPSPHTAPTDTSLQSPTRTAEGEEEKRASDDSRSQPEPPQMDQTESS